MTNASYRAFFSVIGMVVVLSPAASAFGAQTQDDQPSIIGLRNALVAMSPSVSPEEAQLLSETVHSMSRELAREYGVTGDPAYHNFLINIGAAQRGYCAHYVRDMGTRLRQMNWQTLVLHWGAAYAKESDENNGIVVTAVNQPFLDGIVLDAWRHGGRLYWGHVRDDKEYEVRNRNPLGALGPRPRSGITAWKENPQESAWLQDKVDIVRVDQKAKAKPGATPATLTRLPAAAMPTPHVTPLATLTSAVAKPSPKPASLTKSAATATPIPKIAALTVVAKPSPQPTPLTKRVAMTTPTPKPMRSPKPAPVVEIVSAATPIASAPPPPKTTSSPKHLTSPQPLPKSTPRPIPASTGNSTPKPTPATGLTRMAKSTSTPVPAATPKRSPRPNPKPTPSQTPKG